MATYLYQLSYTADSLAAQIKKPQDRLVSAAKPVIEAVGGKLLGGGFSFGEFDVTLLYEAPNDESAAAIATAVAAGGAIRAAKTTKLLSGRQWVSSLKKAAKVGAVYKPATGPSVSKKGG